MAVGTAQLRTTGHCIKMMNGLASHHGEIVNIKLTFATNWKHKHLSTLTVVIAPKQNLRQS